MEHDSKKQAESKEQEDRRPGGGEWVVGVDLGDRWSHYCQLNGEGQVAGRGRVATKAGAFAAWLEGRPRMCVVLEVGTHSPWVSREVEGAGQQVLVANARQVRLIYEDYGKHDVRDAEMLARLGRVDAQLLKPIQHRGAEAQADLAVIRARQALVGTRSKLINAARGMVKAFGYRAAGCSAESFPRQAREGVPGPLRPAILPLLQQIAQLTRSVRRYDRQIEELARRRYPQTKQLEQVTGVGVLTALAYLLTLEEPQRFGKSRDVGPYLGLTPKRQQSGERDPQLRITKAGNSYLRQLLVSSAHYILGPLCRQESDLRRWGLRLAERGGKKSKKRAVVGVARRLAVLLHRLWVTGEEYVPLHKEYVAQHQVAASEG